MLRVNRCMAFAFVVTLNTGVSNAENHPASFGQYSTAVNETRLFVEDSGQMTLRCDLFFSATGTNQVAVAPKGSVVSQAVPTFVWQYSGLLPVSDYLKTVAIHSFSSEEKEASWQDVQLAFYNGLRVEGARESDAKIAYAGAYGFAPRWPLVELVGIADPQQDENSELYKVAVTPVGTKGISVDEYRALARDILSDPELVSLQDIRGVIDAADAAVDMKAVGVVGGSINDLFASNREQAKADAAEAIAQPMEEKAMEASVGTSVDDLFRDEAALPEATEESELEESSVDSVALAIPQLDVASEATAESQLEGLPVESVVVTIPKLDAAPEATEESQLEGLPVESVMVAIPQLDAAPDAVEVVDNAILGPEDTMIDVEVVDDGEATSEERKAVTVDTSLGAQPAVWKTMPDGSMVLVQIEG